MVPAGTRSRAGAGEQLGQTLTEHLPLAGNEPRKQCGLSATNLYKNPKNAHFLGSKMTPLEDKQTSELISWENILL